MPRRFALLDRDGTIIIDRGYLADPAGVALLDGAAAGLRRLIELGYGLIVVSNQSGVGRGMFPRAAVDRVNERMLELLAREQVRVDGIYFCPHSPDDACVCRKPLPGMIAQAVSDLDFDPAAAVVIGDKATDIEMGQAVGAKTILIGGGEDGTIGRVRADAIAANLTEAAEVVAAWSRDEPLAA